MFKFLKKWFTKEKPIKKFSTTLTTATEGSNNKKDISPEVAAIVKKLKKNSNENISNEELNTIISHFFNLKPVEPGVYNINKLFTEGMCFDISRVHTVYNKEGDIENIFINLREITFSNDIVVTVSIKDFHETFNRLDLQPVVSKE